MSLITANKISRVLLTNSKGWKFLPIIGQYVVEMLKGGLSREMTRRWEWDRSFEGYPKNILLPERELRDLED